MVLGTYFWTLIGYHVFGLSAHFKKKIEIKHSSSRHTFKPRRHQRVRRRLIYSRALAGLAALFRVLQTHAISMKKTKNPTTMRVLATDIVWVPFLDTTRNTTGRLSVQQSTITHTEITYSPAMVVIVIILCESGGKLDALDPKKYPTRHRTQ